MNDSYAYAGKRIADRFELISPVSPQPELAHASLWLAQDTVRSVKLRAIVIDPDFTGITHVLDEARKTSYIHSGSDSVANMVSTIAVVDNDGDYAIFTELPPGQPLSAFLDSPSLPTNLVHSLIGDIVSAINMSKSHGLRHLALTPDDIYLTDAGDIVVDGYGIQAALNEVPSDLPSDVLDRYEAAGLVNLLAFLLTGKLASVDALGEVDEELVHSASDIADLPAEISNLLAELREGNIPQSPNELLLKLVPWDDIDMSTLLSHKLATQSSLSLPELLDVSTSAPTSTPIPHAIFPKVFDDDEMPAADDDTVDETETASTAGDATDTNDAPEATDVETHSDETDSDETEPSTEITELSADTTRASSTETRPKVDSAVEKAHELSERARHSTRKHVEAAKNIDLNKPVNTSHFVITILVVAIVIAAIFAISNLLQPLRDVTVEPPKPHAEHVTGSETGAPANPPVIAGISLVDPDSGKFFPADPVPNSPETVPQAIDGDDTTRWLSWYFNSPDMGDISGIGLHVTFTEAATLSGVTLNLDGKGGNLQVRTGGDPAAGDVLYEGPVDGATHLTVDTPIKTSDILLWFTELPVDSKGYNRISLAEITVE